MSSFVKDCIRNGEAGLISAWIGSTLLALCLRLFSSSWDATIFIIGGMSFCEIGLLSFCEFLIWYLGKDDKPLMKGCTCPVPGRNYRGAKAEGYLTGRLGYDNEGNEIDTQCPIHGGKVKCARPSLSERLQIIQKNTKQP